MGVPRTYALGVLLERLHRDREAQRNINERLRIIHKRNDTIRKLRQDAERILKE